MFASFYIVMANGQGTIKLKNDFCSISTDKQITACFPPQRIGYYLVESKLVPQYFGILIKGFRFPQKEKLPSVYAEGGIVLIGNAINKSEFGDKRLYAVFMLASRSALRTSDIINLKFENIDWDKSCIFSLLEREIC